MKKFNFNTDINLEKAETEEYFEVSGIASTPDPDLQQEIIDQGGLDISNIQYFNDDHGNGYSCKKHAKLGIIDEAKLTPQGLFVKGKVFKNHPGAMVYYNELKHGGPGRVKFSVEGSVVERDQFNPKRIKKAKILGVALTNNPVNNNTYAQLVKSFNEIPVGFEDEAIESLIYTPEQVAALLKAMGIAQNYGTTPPAQLTGGSAMQKENLDRKKKSVTPEIAEEPKSEESSPEEKKEVKKDKEPKKVMKSITSEQFSENIEDLLTSLQKSYPESTRNELWELVKNRLEINFFDKKSKNIS
jgi:hypothetical protein